MAYHINHKRYIIDRLCELGLATAVELAKAVPRKRRTQSSVQTMQGALAILCREGRVKRLSRGVYALAVARLALADGVTHNDPIGRAIVDLLAPQVHFGVHADDVYAAVLPLSHAWSRDGVMKSLRRLQRYDVVFKTRMHWSIRPSALVVSLPDWYATEPTNPTPEIDIFS